MSVRVLDLYCGGGGSSWGAKMAGAEIACGIDAWDIAVSVYNDNFNGKALLSRIEADSYPGIASHHGPFDMILASPECTSHTCARGNRPRNEGSRLTAQHVLHYLKYYNPRWAVLENVIHMKQWHKFGELLERLRGLGYKVRTQTLDASHFGVPQTRKRLFILCDKMKEPIDIVAPVAISAKTARDILDPPERWKSSPLYSPRRAHATLMRVERAHSVLLKKEDFLVVYYGSDASGGWQSLDRPLRTLTTLDRFGLVNHTSEGLTLRMLQVPELKRAMGFDDNFNLRNGSRRDQVKILGNGVCPPVMAAIVRSLAGEALN